MIAWAIQSLLVIGTAWIVLRRSRGLFGKHPLDNIPGPAGGSFLAGHFDKLWDQSEEGWGYHKRIAAKYGCITKIRGPFGAKALFVYDPKSLHHIIIKDQHIYEETPGFLLGNNLIFGPGLLATLGEQHRKQRKMLNPVFSMAHMREMIPTFYDVTHKLRDAFMAKVSKGPQEIDVSRWMSRAALELIGQSGLGYTFDSLAENAQENNYTHSIKRFNDLVTRANFARHYILPLVHDIGTPWLRRSAVEAVPCKTLKELRLVVDVMHRTAVDVIESKRKVLKDADPEATSREIGRGKDIISILLKANVAASEGDRLSEEELVGQVSTLTFAAMDTTSNALSRTLYLLSQHPEVQDKLREEIRDAHQRCGTERLEYDALVSLPYLDAICRETLRLYPPIPTVIREPREDVILPLSKPVHGQDGSELTEVFIPKGTIIFLSLLSANRNPDIWGPDSFEWKPERWINGLPDSVSEAKIPGVYSHLMTFLGGGRACIGFKFAQLEMKVVLCALLDKFKFSLVEGKEIEWKMTGIVTPAVVGESGQQLPLVP